jgi:hypothetical protein
MLDNLHVIGRPELRLDVDGNPIMITDTRFYRQSKSYKPKQMKAKKTFHPVNNPSHYTDGKIETIDFIEDKKLGFNLGNAVKYISRAGKKDPSKHIEDLEKAQWYLSREIANLKKPK